MTVPRYLPFYRLNGQVLSWTLQDSLQTNFPVDGSTVVATLYQDRSVSDPNGQPGTPIAEVNGLALVGQGSGLYQGAIAATFDPGVGANYVLVVDATHAGYQPQHWEVPAVVIAR